MVERGQDVNIDGNIRAFIDGEGKSRGRLAAERYASFDYCFNYFQGFREAHDTAEMSVGPNMQTSCLHLAFYLASWGMLRGSSFLLEKSVKFYESVVRAIVACDLHIWSIDIDDYSEDNIDALLDCKTRLRAALGTDNNPSDTLITKIMLGVFANVPALDQFVRTAFGVHSLTRRGLRRLSKFYVSNRQEIDKHVIYTLDLESGQPTGRLYTKAKLVDMIGFVEGQRRSQIVD